MPSNRSALASSSTAAADAAMDVGPSGKGLFVGDWGTPDKIAMLVETYDIFSNLDLMEQGQARDAAAAGLPNRRGAAAGSSSIPQISAISNYHRVSRMYREAVLRYREKTLAYEEPNLDDAQLASDLHAVLSLADTLYLPADGTGAGVVGEELLHWLNSYDIAPTTEEGLDIAAAPIPHEHPRYWDYVLQSVLRGLNEGAIGALESLTRHNSQVIARIAKRAIQLLQSFPRSTSYQHEVKFVQDRKAWQLHVRQMLQGLEAEMDGVEEELGQTEEAEDLRIEYEVQYRCLLELMAGVRERVFEACSDWREALGAWGLLVQPTMKRDDVPDVVATILEQHPPDLTLPLELCTIALSKGEVQEACQHARELDPWLAVHMADLLFRAAVLEDDSQ